MDKVKDILVLFFAGGDGRPDALAPMHACLAASALRNPPIYNRMAYITFSAVVGRLNCVIGHEPEIIFGSVAFKSSGECFRRFMIRRIPHDLQKAIFDLPHLPRKTLRQIITFAVQYFKKFLSQSSR